MWNRTYWLFKKLILNRLTIELSIALVFLAEKKADLAKFCFTFNLEILEQQKEFDIKR